MTEIQQSAPGDRTSGIGASESAAILGVSAFESPYDVWEVKMGRAPAPDTAATYWGRVLEDVVAREYAKLRDVRVRRTSETRRHPEAPLMAHADRYIEGRKGLLECKTSHQFMSSEWGPDGSDEIPIYYMVQVQHQLLCYRRSEFVDLAVLIGGRDFRTYRIGPDREIQDTIVEACTEFWQEHVQRREPPDVRSIADALKRWPMHHNPPVEADQWAYDKARELLGTRARRKGLEEHERALTLELMRYMGNAEALITSQGQRLVSWKTPRPSRVLDQQSLKRDRPDIADEFTIETPGSRRFTPNDKADVWEATDGEQ